MSGLRWVALLVSFVVFVWCVAYRTGSQQMREFEALCETPGVVCVAEFTPNGLARIAQPIRLPGFVVGTLVGDDGRLTGTDQVGCVPGEVAMCSEGDWRGMASGGAQ